MYMSAHGGGSAPGDGQAYTSEGYSPESYTASPAGVTTTANGMMSSMPGAYQASCGSAAHTPSMPYATAEPVGYGHHGGVSATGGVGELQFSQQELQHYESLFNHVDKERKGYVDSLSGGHFLMSSGLPQSTLRTVWHIADSNTQGSLTRERFFVALRLVAHAQASRQLSPSLAMVEPPVLPDFQGVQRRRAPSECSGPPSMVGGAHSDISELQPVIASGEDQVRRAAEFARLANKGQSPRGPRWTPSQREKRKYASLFKRTDGDNDGFVEGWEAKTLLERSKMDVETLKLTWEHADQNHDGKLDFREFVILVHMVACVIKGLPLPDPREGLPPELANALLSLEPPDVLIAQREASRSRSASPAHSGHASPAFLSTPAVPSAAPAPAPSATGWSPAAQFASSTADDGARWGMGSTGGSRPSSPPVVFRETDGAAAGADWGMAPQEAAAAPVDMGLSGAGGFASDWGTAGGFETNPPEGEERHDDKHHRKKKKKDKSRDPPVDRDQGGSFGPSAAPLDDGGFGMGWGDGFTEQPRLTSPTGSPLVPAASDLDPSAGGQASTEYDDWGASSGFAPAQPRGRSRSRERDEFADNGAGFADRRDRERHDSHSRERERQHQESLRANLSQVVTHFEAVISADRAVSRQLRREVDGLEEELRQIREARHQLERQVHHEQQESERLAQQRRQLEAQTQDAKRRLAELREDRRAVNLESISLRRDRCHFSEELAFLKRTAEDEERTLEVIRRANQFLDKSYRDLELHTEQLEGQRKELLQEVHKERELVRTEERHSAEMRNRLERMRREHAASVSELREANLRELRIREMQGDSGLQGGAWQATSNGHSWAHKVMGAPGVPAASAAPAPGLAAGAVLGAGVARGGYEARGSLGPGGAGALSSRGAGVRTAPVGREGV